MKKQASKIMKAFEFLLDYGGNVAQTLARFSLFTLNVRYSSQVIGRQFRFQTRSYNQLAVQIKSYKWQQKKCFI